MKLLFAALSMLVFSSGIKWEPDFSKAKETAITEHKYILLNFSGSDWCVPCIRMRKEVFEDTSFSLFAKQNLVLVNADFPRMKKNLPSKEQVKQNESLAEKYNPAGSFPLTLLLDTSGKVIHSWDGLPADGPITFIKELNKAIDARK